MRAALSLPCPVALALVQMFNHGTCSCMAVMEVVIPAAAALAPTAAGLGRAEAFIVLSVGCKSGVD